ncbi:SDR family oxidoreductase [bacterium]|nr:SDR family oxidoreductase [bacterium]
MLNLDLSEKVALITGGSRGIGASICEILAMAGANIFFTHIEEGKNIKTADKLADKIKEMSVWSEHFYADVSDEEQSMKITQHIIEKMGKIDILITCAGTTTVAPIESMKMDEWKRIIDINLNGTFYYIKNVIPHMIEKEKGRIIMIGSAAIVAGGGGGAHYASSKAALEGLNRALTKELASKGIRTNLIHPSLVDTDLFRSRYPDEEERKEKAKTVPTGRLAKPEDIAYLTAFLASDMADYICGQSFFVDGGRTFCK